MAPDDDPVDAASAGPDHPSFPAQDASGNRNGTGGVHPQAGDVAQRAVEGLIGRWVDRYGEVVADIEVERTQGAIRVGGRVLVPSQRSALTRVLREALDVAGWNGAELDLSEVVALTETAFGQWIGPKDDHVDVLASPDGALSTQWRRGEPPIRSLAERGGWLAVELADRTVGWVAASDIAPYAPESGDDALLELADPAHGGSSTRGKAAAFQAVAAWRSTWGGRARMATAADWEEAILPWLGTPYRLGGRRRSGIDCSAFTQRLMKAVVGIGLPRHSKDQARFGQRVGRHDLLTGDLIYATDSERGVSHVALHMASRPAVVVHACLGHEQVIAEGLEGFGQRYQIRAIRRFPEGYVPEPSASNRSAGTTEP